VGTSHRTVSEYVFTQYDRVRADSILQGGERSPHPARQAQDQEERPRDDHFQYRWRHRYVS